MAIEAGFGYQDSYRLAHAWDAERICSALLQDTLFPIRSEDVSQRIADFA